MNDGEPIVDLRKLIELTRDALTRRRAVLFLGAGASMEGQGPSGRELSELVLKHYPNVPALPDQSFLDLCQYIIDTPTHDLATLRRQIVAVVDKLQPTRSHLRMARLPWNAVFTTNYDDVMEQAFRHKDSVRTCEPVYVEDERIPLASEDRVPLIKLMGCARRRDLDSGSMILTRAQYNALSERRNRAIAHLYDCLKHGLMVFVGYSFIDRVVFDAIDHLKFRFGADLIPWSYWIGPTLPKDERGRYQLTNRRVCGVEGTFSQFAEGLWDAARTLVQPLEINRSDEERVPLADCTLMVRSQDVVVRSLYHTLLTDQEVAAGGGDADAFFRGGSTGWVAFRNGWDFVRQALPLRASETGDLRARVIQVLRGPRDRGLSVFVLLGKAGSGKTTLLRRIAYDVYDDGLAPVVILNTQSLGIDFVAIESLVENLRNGWLAKVAGRVNTPFLLVIDDAATQFRQWRKLATFLVNRGYRVVVLAAERDGEWRVATRSTAKEDSDITTYALPDSFGDEDRGRIVSHLGRLGYLRTVGPSAMNIIQSTLTDSPFATFYTFVDPARPPLQQKIESQYLALQETPRLAFGIICLLSSYGLRTPRELLVRSLGVDHDKFHTDVFGGQLESVVYEEQDQNGDLWYRPHHRIVAERIILKFYSAEGSQLDLLRRVCANTNFPNPNDRSVIIRMVVDHVGPNAPKSPLGRDAQRELLDLLIKNGGGRTVLHHRGLIELQDRKYEDAERFLKRALDDHRSFGDSYRRESDQNILTSLGSVYSAWASELRRAGRTAAGERLNAEAERCFVDARHGTFANAHAYHAQASMLRNRARDHQGDEKVGLLSDALQVIDEAKEAVDLDFVQPILELEAEILAEIEQWAAVAGLAAQIAKEHKNAAGYVIWAHREFRNAEREAGARRRAAIARVLEILEEGLRVDAGDHRALQLAARCHRLLGRRHEMDAYTTLLRLKSAYPHAEPRVYYRLACAAFRVRRYKEANALFDELQDLGKVIEFTIRGHEFVEDDAGKPASFPGRVAGFEPGGNGRIECEAFEEPFRTVPFIQRFVRIPLQPGDRVSFFTYFNYRGPYARDISRVAHG